jgi:glycosyltransferase involved in cell wall biosynthesis
MRIALYHDLPSGGAKRTLMESARQLAARHQIDVFTLSCAEHDFGDIRPWVHRHHVLPFEPSRLFASPFGRLNQLLRLADLNRLRKLARAIGEQIDRGGYDVALVHPCRFEQSPSVLRYLTRTPSVYYCHETRRLSYEAMPKRPYGEEATWTRRMLNHLDPLPAIYANAVRRNDRNNVQSADRVLVNSAFTARTVKVAYEISADVSYHGVDVVLFRPLGLPKRHVVLSVGSLTILKGFDLLVRAMAEFSDDRPELVIVSNFENADERVYIEQLARHCGVRLTLLGGVNDDELVRLYNQAQLVAYSPIREPFGLVPLEAMACGTPVVGVNEGGVGESVVDGVTGLLVTRNHRDFATAIGRLIADSTLSQQLGSNGRAHVLQNWTWERATATLERTLEVAAGGSKLSATVATPALVH